MSCPIKLVPELQKLIDDFVSVRQRFADFAATYVQQQILLQKRQNELENATKLLTAMRQKQAEDQRLVESYDRLKRDYELLNSATEKHREEIRAENKRRVLDLEEELRAERTRSSQQAELHQRSVTQIVADYEAKLWDADEKIRQLNRLRNESQKANRSENAENQHPAIGSAKTMRGANKRWPQLAVELKPKASSSRGRGRSTRGRPSKRKLFVSKNERPTDVLQ